MWKKGSCVKGNQREAVDELLKPRKLKCLKNNIFSLILLWSNLFRAENVSPKDAKNQNGSETRGVLNL